MKYDLSKMTDRINLLMIQPTKKHRNGIMWILSKRYPDDMAEIKKQFMITWGKK